MREWCKTIPNVFECCVCKTNMNPSFLCKFINIEKLEWIIMNDPILNSKWKVIFIDKGRHGWSFIDKTRPTIKVV
jgi:hypothetical protein